MDDIHQIAALLDQVHALAAAINDKVEQLNSARAQAAADRDLATKGLGTLGDALTEAQRKIDALTLSRDLERARGDTLHDTISGHILALGNMRLSAIAAGLVEVEVCGGCGGAAPCPHHSFRREKRFVNKRAEEHCSERDRLNLENFHLREKLTSLEAGRDTAVVMLSEKIADFDKHLHTCPPNVCREGHPEIRYAHTEDSLECPLCHALDDFKALSALYDRFFNKRSKEVLSGEAGELTFRRLQEEQKPWIEHNFPGRPGYIPLLGAVEELGELAHAHIKREQGIRGPIDELIAAAKDAVADTVIFLSDYCTSRGFDLQALMEETWAKVKLRDWKADPVTGGSGELSRRQEDELSAQREKERYTGGTHADH